MPHGLYGLAPYILLIGSPTKRSTGRISVSEALSIEVVNHSGVLSPVQILRAPSNTRACHACARLQSQVRSLGDPALA